MNKNWMLFFTLTIIALLIPSNLNYTIKNSTTQSKNDGSNFENYLGNNKISSTISETITQSSSTKIEVQDGEELHIIFSVYEKETAARVTYGTVTITDTITGRNNTYPVYSGGVFENITWLISSSDNPSGWHIIDIVYNGYYDSIYDIEFSVSSSNLNILFLDTWIYANGNPIVMELSMNTTIVTLGQNSTIEISLRATKSSYFRIKSYVIVYDLDSGLIIGLKVFSDDLSEYIVTWQDIFTMNLSIPYYQDLGSRNLRAYYSGSAFVCDHKYNYEDIGVNVKGGAYNLEISLSHEIIERSNNFEDYLQQITVRIFGAEVELGNLELLLIHYQLGINHSLYNITGSPEVVSTVKFNQSNILGNYSFYSSFTIFGESYSTEKSFLLIDDCSINIYSNSSSVNPGNTVLIYGFVSEEDVQTQSVTGSVNLFYSNDTQLNSEPILTDSNGYFEYFWTISNASFAKTISLYSFFIPDAALTRTSVSDEISITITRSVTIMIFTSDGEIYTRGDILNIDISIISGEIPITEGYLSLSLINGTNVVTTEILGLTTTLNWDIPINQLLGLTTLNISYSGTVLYHPTNILQNIRIFSNPYLTDVYANTSELNHGDTISISGYLLDENNEPVMDNQVSIWEQQQYLGAATTNSEGIFVFLYDIPLDYPYGYHFLRITFSGDGLFYNEVFLDIVIDYKVNPILSISTNLETQFNAGEEVILNITGRVHSDGLIQWKLRDWETWYDILVISFSNEGEATVLWQIPEDTKGLLDIRVVDQETQEWAYTTLDIYIIPQILITINDQKTVYFVDEILGFKANCTENYDVYVNDERISAGLNGIKEFDIVIRDRGKFNLTIISYGEFIRTISESLLIDILDYTHLSVDHPAEFNENTSITLNVLVTNVEYLNIEGITVYVQDNHTKTILASAVTNIYGEANPTFTLAIGNYTLNIYTLLEDFYNPSLESIIIIVKTQSILELKPIIGFTEESVTLEAYLSSFSGKAISNASILFDIQLKNNSWERIGITNTSSSGEATISWIILLEPGEYNIKAVYNGSQFVSNSITTSVIYVNAGDGPELIFSNYTFSEVSNEEELLQIQFIAKFDSLSTVTNVNALLGDTNESLLMSKIDNELNSFRLIFQLTGYGNYSFYIIAKNSLNVSSFWFQKLILDENNTPIQGGKSTDFSNIINLAGYLGIVAVATIVLTLSYRIKNTGGI